MKNSKKGVSIENEWDPSTRDKVAIKMVTSGGNMADIYDAFHLPWKLEFWARNQYNSIQFKLEFGWAK